VLRSGRSHPAHLFLSLHHDHTSCFTEITNGRHTTHHEKCDLPRRIRPMAARTHRTRWLKRHFLLPCNYRHVSLKHADNRECAGNRRQRCVGIIASSGAPQQQTRGCVSSMYIHYVHSDVTGRAAYIRSIKHDRESKSFHKYKIRTTNQVSYQIISSTPFICLVPFHLLFSFPVTLRKHLTCISSSSFQSQPAV
jgi:hypothetical protein